MREGGGEVLPQEIIPEGEGCPPESQTLFLNVPLPCLPGRQPVANVQHHVLFWFHLLQLATNPNLMYFSGIKRIEKARNINRGSLQSTNLMTKKAK